MCYRRTWRSAFTLVELLIVIAIITVLIAIGLPVMSRVREKARQTQCIGNLHNIAMALRLYRIEEGGFPGPYDPVTGWGGLNALYPTYLDNRKALICPDDPIEDGEDYRVQFALPQFDPQNNRYATLLDLAGQMYKPGEKGLDPDTGLPYQGCNWKDPVYFSEHYCSYNTFYNWMGYVWWKPEPSVSEDLRYTTDKLGLLPGTPPVYVKSPLNCWGTSIAYWYEWYRWDPENELQLQRPYRDAGGFWHEGNANWYFVDQYLPRFIARQVYWSNYAVEDGTRLTDSLQRPLWDPVALEEDPLFLGMPSAVFPALVNDNAPENTIVTRCPHHRQYTKRTDIALRLDGSTVMIAGPPYLEYQWAVQPRLTH